MDSMKTSMPLLRNSYLPLVPMMRVSSPKVSPRIQLAMRKTSFLTSRRLRVNVAPFGTKSFSKPLGSTTSQGLPRSSRHSRAVMSETVVKASAWMALCFSMECFDCTLSSAAIMSPSYAHR